MRESGVNDGFQMVHAETGEVIADWVGRARLREYINTREVEFVPLSATVIGVAPSWDYPPAPAPEAEPVVLPGRVVRKRAPRPARR